MSLEVASDVKIVSGMPHDTMYGYRTLPAGEGPFRADEFSEPAEEICWSVDGHISHTTIHRVAYGELTPESRDGLEAFLAAEKGRKRILAIGKLGLRATMRTLRRMGRVPVNLLFGYPAHLVEDGETVCATTIGLVDSGQQRVVVEGLPRVPDGDCELVNCTPNDLLIGGMRLPQSGHVVTPDAMHVYSHGEMLGGALVTEARYSPARAGHVAQLIRGLASGGRRLVVLPLEAYLGLVRVYPGLPVCMPYEIGRTPEGTQDTTCKSLAVVEPSTLEITRSFSF